jgi:hypothetical protein
MLGLKQEDLDEKVRVSSTVSKSGLASRSSPSSFPFAKEMAWKAERIPDVRAEHAHTQASVTKMRWRSVSMNDHSPLTFSRSRIPQSLLRASSTVSAHIDSTSSHAAIRLSALSASKP